MTHKFILICENEETGNQMKIEVGTHALTGDLCTTYDQAVIDNPESIILICADRKADFGDRPFILPKDSSLNWMKTIREYDRHDPDTESAGESIAIKLHKLMDQKKRKPEKEIKDESNLDFPPDYDGEYLFTFKSYRARCGDLGKEGNRSYRAGLYMHIRDQDKKGMPISTNEWICSPIEVVARTRTERDTDFGKMVEFTNLEGRRGRWSMPSRMIVSSKEDDIISQLKCSGVNIGFKKESLLIQYLSTTNPSDSLICSSSTGWNGGNNASFIMPDKTLGYQGAIFQNEEISHEVGISSSGTLREWQFNVAKYAKGNDIILLSIAVGLSGSLLKLIGGENSITNLRGQSSKGKTTCFNVGASISGKPGEFDQTWNATGNGLEGKAAARNDLSLFLDEMGECEPRKLDTIIYMICNGKGKQRAKQTGASKHVHRWRLSALSTSEKHPEIILKKAGKQMTAGVENRLIDIEADGYKYGAFNNIHDFENAAEFANHLSSSSKKYHGTALPYFINSLLEDSQMDFHLCYEEARRPELWGARDSLENRVASRMAVFSMAGELSIKYELIGFNPGTFTDACRRLFTKWMNNRTQGSTEDTQILQGIRDFIQRHGNSRFSPLSTGNSAEDNAVIRDQAGWYKKETDGRIWMFTREGLQEASGDHTIKSVTKALHQSEWLITKGSEGRKSITTRVMGSNQRLFHIKIPCK